MDFNPMMAPPPMAGPAASKKGGSTTLYIVLFFLCVISIMAGSFYFMNQSQAAKSARDVEKIQAEAASKMKDATSDFEKQQIQADAAEKTRAAQRKAEFTGKEAALEARAKGKEAQIKALEAKVATELAAAAKTVKAANELRAKAAFERNAAATRLREAQAAKAKADASGKAIDQKLAAEKAKLAASANAKVAAANAKASAAANQARAEAAKAVALKNALNKVNAKVAGLEFVRSAPYGAVPGHMIRPAQHVGDVFGVADPNKCKALARAKGANVWGHRNALHGSAKYKNSCWFYKSPPGAKYAGNKDDKVHMVGCSVGGNPRTGCAAETAFSGSAPFGAVPGHMIRPAQHVGDVFGVADPNKCKALARAKGANVWGHRNALHGSAKYKNSCWFYKTAAGTKYAGNKGDKVHMIGCSVSGNPRTGCTPVPAKAVAKAKYKNSYWKQIGGGLKQVSISGNKVCGVNSADNIYCKTNLHAGNWYQVHGKLKHISLSGNSLYGVNSADNIYYSPNMSAKAPWKRIGGKLKQVSHAGGKVCGVNSADNIYCKTNLTGSNWYQVHGKLKHVSVSKRNRRRYGMYGVNSADNIYYSHNLSAKAPWKKIGGKLKQVSMSGNNVCGVNSGDNIYCKTNLTNSNWKHKPGKLKYISISGTKAYGVNSADNIYYGSNWNR